mmetsp:Transcript_25864/g.45938  ORF Transcript_25864/g.45938 Transcript_25864/m.45938 type:complete len:182 (-) Transcript_25864:487-1032(-)
MKRQDGHQAVASSSGASGGASVGGQPRPRPAKQKRQTDKKPSVPPPQPTPTRSSSSKTNANVKISRKSRSRFFSGIFGSKGPDPLTVREWLPPFLDRDTLQIGCYKSDDYQRNGEVGGNKAVTQNFRMGKFDELGFFHSQLDDIPDSEAKKPNPNKQRIIQRDKEYARTILRSIQQQLQSK